METFHGRPLCSHGQYRISPPIPQSTSGQDFIAGFHAEDTGQPNLPVHLASVFVYGISLALTGGTQSLRRTLSDAGIAVYAIILLRYRGGFQRGLGQQTSQPHPRPILGCDEQGMPSKRSQSSELGGVFVGKNSHQESLVSRASPCRKGRDPYPSFRKKSANS